MECHSLNTLILPARSGALCLYDRKIRKNPNPFPIWKIWFGLYWFGAPSGARTLGTLIKSQVTFFRALMKQRNAAHFCFCGFYVDMAVNLQGQF